MDHRFSRYFSSLREEAEAAQRGASSCDVSEVIRDISDVCEDLITDEDVSLALASVFDPSTGIFDVVQRLMLNREKSVQKGRESCLVFVAEFIRKANLRVGLYVPFIKDQCINIFQRDESKAVQAASLLPLITILELLIQSHDFANISLDWTMAKIFLKEYPKAKSSGTLRANILMLLGAMVESFPSSFEEENIVTILNLCLDSLDEQLKQKGKDPSFVLVSGAIKCLDGLIMWFDRAVPAGGSVEASRRIYSYIEQVLYFREDLKRYEMVKAGLRLLARHACRFRLRLLDDCMNFLRWLEAYCIHVNAPLRTEALPAFNELISQIAICLSSGDPRINNPEEIYKKLLSHALAGLNAQDQSAKMISLAVRMIGKLSPVIIKFSGEDALQQAFQRVIAFASFSQRINEVQDESLGFLVTLVGAITDIIANLEDIDNYIVTIVAEAVGNIFFKFPYLFPKQKLPVYVTIQDLFGALDKKGTIFLVFLNNIVWSSLQRAIEPISSNQENLGINLWKSYTELWSKLINIENARLQPEEEKSGDILCSTGIQEKFFDAMFVCVTKVLRELNLKYRVKRTRRTDTEIIKEDDDELLPDLDTNKETVEPIDDKDMKKFLNLVEFVQDLLLSDSVPFFPKWVLPFGRSIVELSNSYPLLSGFYKLLAELIKRADDNGYFRSLPQPVSFGNITCSKEQEHSSSVVSNKQSVPEGECILCQDLFQQYIQEVLISSRRYKLELLASCLRLCLSSPPSLIGLPQLVEPLKVALKMGLRYSPLANFAMDALERWIIFSKSELDLWLYQIVPCFNNYLSITLAHAAIEEGSESYIEDNLRDISNRNLSHRRVKRERKALPQSDAIRLTVRIQRFLGRIGMHAHFLVPDINLLQITGTGGLAWDTTEQIKFILPFRDDKADLWLDSLLPRIVDLALSASDRSTKVCASELLHASCLLMMGNCAKGPRTRTGDSVHYDKIYRKVFPAVIRLAADVEQVTCDLFSRLLFQMIHWFTSNTRKENPDTMALLDAILEGIVDCESASLRELCADCFEEFMKWSIRHTPPEADNFINVTSMLRRLYNRLDHPNPYHRLGSAMACSRLYRVMRVHTSIVDRHMLELLFFCIKSLRIAEEDHEQIGTVKQICKVLDEFQRLLQRNISSLVLKRKDRAMFTTIDDFLTWLFKQTMDVQEKCRGKCMYLFSSGCEVLQDGSALNWLKSSGKSQMLEETCVLLNTKFTFMPLDHEEILLEKLELEIKSFCRSLHWYEWGLKIGLMKLEHLYSTANNLTASITEFLRILMNEKTAKLASVLTPSQFEHQEVVRTRAIMHLMNFTLEVLYKEIGIQGDDVTLDNTENINKYKCVSQLVPINDTGFAQFLCLLLLSPQEVGIKHIPEKGDALLRLVVRIMKLLACSSYCKENVLQCLKLLLERPEFDLTNLSGSNGNGELSGLIGLMGIEHLLKGYKQLLHAGMLLPALGMERSRLLAEKLLMNIVEGSKNSTTLNTNVSADILSLCISLGIKFERVLEVAFDQAPVASLSDSRSTVGSVFYITFRTVLIHHCKFFYKEILPILLKKSHQNPTARLILSALLDDYLQARKERSIIPIHSFIYVFMKHISFLNPLANLEGSYKDKLFFLEVLNKLLVLDSDYQTVLSSTQPSFEFIVNSFLSLLGGSCATVNSGVDAASKSMNLVVQNSALALVPSFANAASAGMFSNRLLNVLTGIVSTFLLVREADLPPGSTQRATYLQTLNGILEAVCVSKKSELLEVLFPILQNCIPLARSLVIKALEVYALSVTDERVSICSMCLQVIRDGSKAPTLKQALTEMVLIPMLDAAPLDFIMDWFMKHIKDLVDTISEKPPLGMHRISEEEEDYLVLKSCTYSIISCLFMKVDGSMIRDTITPIVSNQQIMQLATNESRAKNDPAQYPFPENCGKWRELHIRAYNCLAAVVMCTQEQERIFTILFKDFAGKPLWQHLIDCKKIYDSFPVEVSQFGSLQDVTRNLRAERKAPRVSESISPFVSSLHVIGATLSQEPALINSFVGDESRKEMGSSEVSNVNTYGGDIIDMEIADQDDFDQHPCLAMVLRVILHLHSKFKGNISDEMPEWMKALHSTLCNTCTPMNVCLFIIKVIIKARKIFSPFGVHWIQPVLQPFLREPQCSGGKRFHYVLRDICITLLEWKVSIPPDTSILSRFLNYLLEVASVGSSQVLRANLEIIQHLLSRWKGHVTVDIDILSSYLTTGGKNPSTSDKMILMNRMVGLQLLGAMMSVGLRIYDDISLPKSELTKLLLSNINLKARSVYEASAEILGMVLHQDEGLYHEQQLQNGLKRILLGLFKEGELGQYLSILDKITMHFPSVLEEYASMVFDLLPRVHGVFRVLSLTIILRRATAIPNLFTVVLPFLSKLLTHRDEAVQIKSLHLVAELVKDADSGAIIEHILPVLGQTFILHGNDECRNHYYQILVYLYTERKMEGHEMLSRSLLQGLSDDSSAIRAKLKSFWHTQLNKNPQQRLLEIITHIYDPIIESHWMHIGSSLLLKLCEESVDFNRPIFNAPLSECEFKEYTIDTSFRGGTLPMTPMFLDTLSATSQAVQSDEMNEAVQVKNFPGMVRATMQLSESLEPSQSQSSFPTSFGESGSSLFAFSKRNDTRTLGEKSAAALGEDGITATVTRRLMHPSASRPQMLRSVFNAMKRREARKAQQALERANKVQILRRYRVGELPDIEINHSEIINPLAALAEKDPLFSRLLLLVLVRAIYSLSPDRSLGREHDLKSLVTKGIEKMFEQTWNDISFVSFALSLSLEDKESWMRPELIESVSTKSSNYQSGILYLENAILRKNVPWKCVPSSSKRHIGSRGQISVEANSLEHAWLALANLYRSLGESDIVLSIYKKHLTRAHITHQALEAELSGELGTALRMYDDAIDKVDEVEWTGISSEIEQDLWYTRRLQCLGSLLNWHAVMDEILFQVDNSLSKLWEPRAQDCYLSLFIRAAIKMPTHHAMLSEFLQPISEDNDKKKLILTDYSTQVVTLAVSNDQLDRARFYVHECYKCFIKQWAKFHPLATSARHILITNLQKITELNEFLDHVESNKFCDWSRIMLEWSKRWPSPSIDDAETWDDIVQNRLLFFQKIQSAFNRCLKPEEEYEGRKLASQLDEERAHVYFIASRGLMKQGSYEAAKSFMNQFVAFKKEKLDYKSYKNIIKLRCLEADRVSIRDPQKSIHMLEQVLSYISSTSHKYNKKDWKIGLKLLEGATKVQLAFLNIEKISQVPVEQCIAQLGSAFSVYNTWLHEMDECVKVISARTLAKSALKFAFFCDELLQSATLSRWRADIHHAIQVGSDVLPEVSCYPRLVVRHVMKALYLDNSVEAHHGIARVLTLIGQYKDAALEFQAVSKDVERKLFIPWIPQILSNLDNDDGETLVGILEDISREQPQAVYFSFNVSRLGLGPVGRKSTVHLNSILNLPILESLVRSLEDLTFPEQRLRDGLSWIKAFLQAGDNSKAKECFCSLVDDCLDIESMIEEKRRAGEYNVKFCREYSKKVVDIVGKDGSNLLSMNDKQFTQATASIFSNLQKSLQNLQSGCMSLSLFSKWLADFDQSKSTLSSQNDIIHMFGSYNSFKQLDPSLHVKIASFDETIVSLSSKQRPKVLKVRGSDELEYQFIVKGGEDLRLDQRIEQIFEIMNSILSRDASCSKRNLSVRTYAVIPVSQKCGLLQFVQNTRALDEVIKDGLAYSLTQLGFSGKGASAETTSNVRLKFQEWLSKRGASQNIANCYRNMYSTTQFPEMEEKMNSFAHSIPWDSLRNGLLKLTTSAESFLALRSVFQRSLAVMSICGYIAGVGDRHLSNILVDTKSGSLVPIDFGYSFGTGVMMLPVPELVPFRLTRQLTNVLLPQDATGLIRTDMIHIMTALRKSRDVITAVMNVFVKEPLLDWKAEAMKASSWRNDEEVLEASTSYEEQHVALKVDFARRKLDLWNPAAITVSELHSSMHAQKPYFDDLTQIVRGDPSRNARARVSGDICGSVQELVDCLIDQATDANLLGRIWLGWQPWV